MWALIEDNTITKIINNPKAMLIGDTQYSRNIFSFRWSNEEREAIGIYEVVFNNTNKKDEEYYTNTNQSFAFADGVVTASFGSATAKAHADANATDSDGNDLDPVVVIPDMLSKNAFVNDKSSLEKKRGKAPKIAIVIQDKDVSKNAWCKFICLS